MPLRSALLSTLTVTLMGAITMPDAHAQAQPQPQPQTQAPEPAPGPASASPSTAAVSPADRPAPTQACRLPGVAHELRCGSVSRALDPTRPDGARIDVHYVVAPAAARRKRPDPVLMLAGGPGQSAIALAPAVLPLLRRLNARRDLVFIDQRGTGRSAALDCDDRSTTDLAQGRDLRQQLDLLRACRDRLAALPALNGLDGLRHFTTTVAMQDIDAVRRALGAPQVNVIGGSYGTRAALELMRQFPDTVRRAILDGVAPPDMALPASMSTDAQAALDAMFTACAADSACARAHPQLRRDWAALLSALPRPVSVRDPRTGRTESFTLRRDMLLAAVRTPLYSPVLASALPQALAEAAAGRFEPLAGLNAMASGRPGRGASALAIGMHFSVVCAEDLPRLAASRDAPGRDFGDSARALYEPACADWPRGTVPPDFYRVPPARQPVLVLSGGADPVTPPRHGARVAAALGPLASHRVVPNAGHGLIGVGCVRDLLLRFIDAPDNASALAVDSACVTGIPRPPAVLPAPGEARP